jgi:hypothetical protein
MIMSTPNITIGQIVTVPTGYMLELTKCNWLGVFAVVALHGLEPFHTLP